MTDIEQRASNYEHDVEASKRKNGDVNANGNGNYDSIDVFEAYKDGATEQKEIDDKELSDALFVQRLMLIEKAVKHIMITPAYAVQPEVYAEGLKKAMEG